jgi:hypothetical protein
VHDGSLWAGLERLVARASDPATRRRHRLQMRAARSWRRLGREVPDDFQRLERVAVAVQIAAPDVLRRVRAVVDGPILLHKGPEAAAVYPDTALRGFSDIDLIVPDAAASQRLLIAAGFVEIGAAERFVGIQHLRPLEWPGLPLRIEVHSEPKWPERLAPPSFDELFAAARPATVGVDGILAPARAHHALMLAAHGWAHSPLRRIADLLDVAAMANGVPGEELEAVAREWEIERLWRTTFAAASAVFLGGPRTAPLRTWARHLPAVRERTVLEAHLERLFSGFSSLPRGAAMIGAWEGVSGVVLPAADESWSDKLLRTRSALRHARRPRASHADSLGPLAQRPRRRRADHRP